MLHANYKKSPVQVLTNHFWDAKTDKNLKLLAIISRNISQLLPIKQALVISYSTNLSMERTRMHYTCCRKFVKQLHVQTNSVRENNIKHYFTVLKWIFHYGVFYHTNIQDTLRFLLYFSSGTLSCLFFGSPALGEAKSTVNTGDHIKNGKLWVTPSIVFAVFGTPPHKSVGT